MKSTDDDESNKLQRTRDHLKKRELIKEYMLTLLKELKASERTGKEGVDEKAKEG